MQSKTYWIFDQFFDGAAKMRQKIDEHFDERHAFENRVPFDKRCIWNYWFIEGHYTYLRTNPEFLFPVLHRRFMEQLSAFVAQEFGMQCEPGARLSMYVNGCGQIIHNDAGNGYLAFVFSLTHWRQKHFDGGETIVYKLNSLNCMPGEPYADMIPPVFNRLLIFDDSVPHAVRPIQGTMDPADARYVLHGHIRGLPNVAYAEGGLRGVNLAEQWKALKQPVVEIVQSHGYYGFVTFEVIVPPNGQAENIKAKHHQLWPTIERPEEMAACIQNAVAQVSAMRWPEAAEPSVLVFSVFTGTQRSQK